MTSGYDLAAWGRNTRDNPTAPLLPRNQTFAVDTL